MTQLHQQRPDREDNNRDGLSDSAGDIPTSSARFNMLTGIVTSMTMGLTRTTVRIRVGERTDLRVRWEADSPSQAVPNIGKTVHLTIPAEAVHLEAGGFRRGKQRWNRWLGRVVLVNNTHEGSITTVKLHRDSITLNSVGAVVGTHDPLAPWDTVNVVVDPEQIRLAPVRRPYSHAIPSVSSLSIDTQSSSVWLRATIQSVRTLPAGLLVALNVGGVHLSAVIESSPTSMPPWKIGASVDISINGSEGRIRYVAGDLAISCSIVLSSEIGVPQHPVSLRSIHV